MEKIDLYETVRGFFDGLEGSRLRDRIREHLRESDRALQFEPSDGEPFYVEMRQGEVEVGKGRRYAPDFEGGLYVKGDREALRSLFEGDVSLAEAIYDHKIRIPGYRNKEPVMVWFSKLLRIGRGIRD